MKFPRYLLMLSSLLFLFSKASAESLKVGDSAPAVTGVTETGEKLNFAEVYKKGYTLVYFYPKADTGGCTAQGCSLRDSYADLTKHGVSVIGVSLDNSGDQKKFHDKYQFPFTLIADPQKTVVNAFGVPTMTVPGMGELAKRQAYLIDKNGKVVWCDYKASTKEQAADVLKALTALGG
jgi:peroxiredoxin Q/BCP